MKLKHNISRGKGNKILKGLKCNLRIVTGVSAAWIVRRKIAVISYTL